MKFSQRHHKAISTVVLVAFVALLQGYSAPAAVKGSGETAVERGGDAAPGSFEKQGDEGAAAGKKKKFPWLLTGLGAVAVGVAVYFLLSKKTKYTLTVTLDPSASGTPETTARYNKGTVVLYAYAARQGFPDPQVKLNGVAVPTSGSIVMNRDHRLVVTTPGKATLQVTSMPAGAKIYLDKVDSGFVTPHTFIFLAPTSANVLLRYACGYAENVWQLFVNLGQDLQANNVFLPGIHEYFDIPLSPCWRPRDPANWSVGSGVLSVANTTGAYEFACYEHPFAGDFLVNVEQRSWQFTKRGTMGVILSTDANLADSKGYEFAFIESDKYVIYKNYDYNHFKDKGYWTYIQRPTLCPPRNRGIGAWNAITIIKAGNNYTFYVNNKLVFSFMDVRWDVRYLTLGVFDQGMKVDYDSVQLALGKTRDSVPGQPAVEIPGKEGERGGMR